MSKRRQKFEVWTIVSVLLALFFLLFLIYPISMLLKQAFFNEDGFTLEQFVRFFEKPYYYNTILNSAKVSICTTLLSLAIGTLFSYFYSFYNLKGAKVLLIVSVLCSMSAPFIGAYSWILLLGRSGLITKLLKLVGLKVGSIYGFKGILIVQASNLYPLVFIYMNGLFKNIDNSLLEASANLGCSGAKRFFTVILRLAMPTILASALLVFMRAFADFGTPLLIGEGYRTFTVEIYTQFLSEVGSNYAFASAISVIAILITTVVFLLQKYATKRNSFTMNSLHPIEKKNPKGFKGFLMHLFCYVVIAIAALPQIYIIILSFRNSKSGVMQEGYSFNNYIEAADRHLLRATKNTVILGVAALALIILFAIMISYLSVRRPSPLNRAIDTFSMIPYIMPGAVMAIALVSAFGKKPLILTGTMIIMILSITIRRMPNTIRSSTASLIQIPISIEEAALSLGASKLKTFFKITVPMMSNGIISGAILSWVSIVTEVSSTAILYTNSTMTLTIGTYSNITRGNLGVATVFATVTTVLTMLSLLIYLLVSDSDDIKL